MKYNDEWWNHHGFHIFRYLNKFLSGQHLDDDKVKDVKSLLTSKVAILFDFGIQILILLLQ